METFIRNVIAEARNHMTDCIFLYIQNKRGLMQEYLRLVESEGINVVNPAIGAAVKQEFQLTNAPERDETPVSTLIKSHQIFEQENNHEV